VGSDALGQAFDMAIGATLLVGIVVSVLFSLTACASARSFRRQRHPRSGPTPVPGVTVLKPLHGRDPYLYENLRSLCAQHYPTFQIVFGVRDPHDPAIAIVERLQREHPDRRIDLVVDGRLYGANRKVSNLHNMYRVARHDVLVIADSDVRVPADYLQRLAAAVADPAVGIVSCLYRACNTATLPARVESLCIDTDFVRWSSWRGSSNRRRMPSARPWRCGAPCSTKPAASCHSPICCRRLPPRTASGGAGIPADPLRPRRRDGVRRRHLAPALRAPTALGPHLPRLPPRRLLLLGPRPWDALALLSLWYTGLSLPAGIVAATVWALRVLAAHDVANRTMARAGGPPTWRSCP